MNVSFILSWIFFGLSDLVCVDLGGCYIGHFPYSFVTPAALFHLDT